MEERVAVSLEEAKETAVSILEGLGVPAKDAEITAEILIDTEAGGVESHGLIRLKDYVDRLVSGQIDIVIKPDNKSVTFKYRDKVPR